MNPIHIVTEKDNIAPLVLLPGDPLRAKYIAENYLENPKLVNNVRNMLGYTGTYKGKRITVIGSGMGIASVAIYAMELYMFYNVKKIIRIGSAGALSPKVHVRDIILAKVAHSNSNFRYGLLKSKSKKATSSNTLNQIIENTSKKINIPIVKGNIYTSEIFDVYASIDHLLNKMPKNANLLASEMEAFGLFTVADYCKKDAACLVSITDSKFERDKDLSHDERRTTLNQMVELALESIIKTK